MRPTVWRPVWATVGQYKQPALVGMFSSSPSTLLVTTLLTIPSPSLPLRNDTQLLHWQPGTYGQVAPSSSRVVPTKPWSRWIVHHPPNKQSACVLLCFIKPILGIRYGSGVSSRASKGSTNPRLKIADVPPHHVLPQPGGGVSSPFTLTTSLAVTIPSSSSSNEPIN